jgi:glutamate synthase domain-containing protein 3
VCFANKFPDGMMYESPEMGYSEIVAIEDQKESDEIKSMVERYVDYTGAKEAKSLLEDWNNTVLKIIKVMPVDYKRVLANMPRTKDEQDVSA